MQYLAIILLKYLSRQTHKQLWLQNPVATQCTCILGSHEEHLRECELGAELRGLRLPGSALASQMDSMSVLTPLELSPGCPVPGRTDSVPGSLSAGLLSCSSMSSVAHVKLLPKAFCVLCTVRATSLESEFL